MGMFIAPETPHGKELWKWDHLQSESHPMDSSIKGMRPIHPQLYPAAMYRPMRDDKGILCFEMDTARDENHRATLESSGYVYGGKGEALKVMEKRESEIAGLAANRAYQERTMSPRAQAEAERHDNETDQHVPVIPEAPKKRGRKPKAQETH